MKLAFSNIAWEVTDDERVLEMLSRYGFSGLEIAPTKLWGAQPYSCIPLAIEYKNKIKEKYGLTICSMQSLWYGMTGNIFSSDEDRLRLYDYTCKAVDFASAIGCRNLVFGNPKARNRVTDDADAQVLGFFRGLALYAKEKGTCLSLEPNPDIYGTNFVNTTAEAFDYCGQVPFMKVNADLGTIIHNGENMDDLLRNIHLVNHIHISEPYLKKIVHREIHKELRKARFDGYISVEMGQPQCIEDVFDTIAYIGEVLAQ